MTEAGWAQSAAFALLATQAACAAAPDGQEKAVVAICAVLLNVRFLFLSVLTGIALLAYLPCIIAAVLVFRTLMDDTKSIKTVRDVVKALLIGVPFFWMVTVAAIYVLAYVFEGGKCPFRLW